MIVPTIGRVVLFHPGHDDTAMVRHGLDEPFAAQVAWVWPDGLLNLSVVDHEGRQFPRCTVPLIQDGARPPAGGYYCEWMSYQLGQAAKTEALEKLVADAQQVVTDAEKAAS